MHPLRFLSRNLSILALALLNVLAHSTDGRADDDSFYPVRYAHIRQVREKNNGVLVSKPDPVDVMIADLLRTQDIQSLDEYAQWLKNHILYRPDGKIDIWTAPPDTLKNGAGDCEDFSQLTAAVAQVMGYRPHFLAVARSGQWHAICAFNDNGRYVWFDNQELKKTDARTLEEFGLYITGRYQYPLLLEFDPSTRRWKVIYRRS